uniref:Period circadian protein n=1 Tax=Antheraea pernyi TaxID=7119 RepID=PER_ANTPE|nr:RecName: Full=Period circadian protein [Antheraea pernyi]AAA64675.1 period clock protein homolog [Antheraea pernyi]
MNNMDGSENNAKVSDSAYSNSCSNSQSRRSHSSKSTHSGSNSSGSSGYGGQPSTSSSSNDLSDQKKEKELKKKKQVETLMPDTQIEVECRPEEDVINIPSEEGGAADDVLVPSPKQTLQTDNDIADIEVAIPDTNNDKEEAIVYNTSLINPGTACPFGRPALSNCNGFSCVISMHDGVVLYATASLTSTLGFPKDMWVGRSFIDFVHPRDRNTFASQITNELAIPKIVSLTEETDQTMENPGSTMVCRIRRYRGLSCGFSVKNTTTAYLPFLLKFKFKNVNEDKGNVIYLVIQAVPFFSAFKTSNEVLAKTVSFVIRHSADGNLEYIDAESVPYLGYLPQDITNRDALLLYHPGDLGYLQEIYGSLVKEGNVTRSKTYRMMTQNGHYMKVETEWSAFINPWSKKLEFVTGKHYIIEGPANPDVFQNPENVLKLTEEQKNQAKMYRDSIIRIMKDVLTKPAEIAKQQMSKRCQDLAHFMEMLIEEQPKPVDDLRLEIQDADHSYYERDSVILGGISPHHEYDSKSSTETPLSYNQLNYNDNLQRYFNSHQSNAFVDNNLLPSRNPLYLSAPHFSESIKNVPSAMEYSGDVIDLTGPGETSGVIVFNKSPTMGLKTGKPIRLTESSLTKHNAEMEKELMKIHREHRCYSKGDRVKVSNEARQKKKEHLARCNAGFQTISAANNTPSVYEKPHNLKRSSKQMESEPIANKHHCPSSRQFRRKQTTCSGGFAQPPSATNPVSTSSQWSSSPVNNVNPFILGVRMQPPMPILSPLPVVSGMFPMYYTPVTATVTTSEGRPSEPNYHRNNMNNNQFQQPLGNSRLPTTICVIQCGTSRIIHSFRGTRTTGGTRYT